MVASHGRQNLRWLEGRAQRRQNGRMKRRSCLLPAHATAKPPMRLPATDGLSRHH
jgi:hypothetical protein